MFISAVRHNPIHRAFALGIPGVLAVIILVPPPSGVPSVALAINPIVLLLLASVAGAKYAPRLGLRSSLFLSAPWKVRNLAITLSAAILAGGHVGIFDHLTAPLWRPVGSGIETLLEASNPSSLMLGVLYGGLTEEIILRWGLMSFAAAVICCIIEPRTALICSVWISAVLFALGHLPGLLLVDPSPNICVMIRTVALNLIAGLLFGFAFLSIQLEAAFTAHMGFHIGIALAAFIGVEYG